MAQRRACLPPAQFLAIALLLTASAVKSQNSTAKLLAVPVGVGSYFGVSLDYSVWPDLSTYVSQNGVQPVAYGIYASMPISGINATNLQGILAQIANLKGVAVVQLEPDQGLAAVDQASILALAAIITQAEQAGATVLVSYGHEMNGNWYVWAQQPSEFIASWRLLAGLLRNHTCATSMLWTPNNGVGYPWSTTVNPESPPLSAADLQLLDTNGDGQLTSADDPYTPYYPGDEYVDWVGMSIYHYGNDPPYGANVIPSPLKFSAMLEGTYGSSSPTFNFYTMFCDASNPHNKPMLIPETSALYNPTATGGDTELAIKQAWWEQAFNVQGDNANALDVSVHFPMIKMILWFDEKKPEREVNGTVIDWRFTSSSAIETPFLQFLAQAPATSNGSIATQSLSTGYWKFLPDFTAAPRDNGACGNFTNPLGTGPAPGSNSTALSGRASNGAGAVAASLSMLAAAILGACLISLML